MAKNSRKQKHGGLSAQAFYAACQGGTIQVVFADGKAFQGRLIGVDTYDLLLELKDKNTLLIPKHAVRYILPIRGEKP